jgi:hypothetical protein
VSGQQQVDVQEQQLQKDWSDEQIVVVRDGGGDRAWWWRRRLVVATAAGGGDGGWWCRRRLVVATAAGGGDGGWWWRRRLAAATAGGGGVTLPRVGIADGGNANVCDDRPVGQEWISGEPARRLQEAVAIRLSLAGWILLEEDELFGSPGVSTFAVSLRDDFAATFVVVGDVLEDESGAVALSPVGLMGLDYEPARRITTALTGFARSGVVLKQPSLVLALPDAGDVADVADSLVRFAAEQAPRLAGLANVDTLIEMLRQRSAAPSIEPMAILNGDKPMVPPPAYPEIPDPVPELVAALLAGAGRYDEARRALAECKQLDPRDGDRENARFVRQLTRWVEHAGKLALPRTPAQWPPDWPSGELDSEVSSTLSQFVAENMPEIPLRTFSDQPSEPAEDDPDPAWMKTPERAAYPVQLSGRERVAVQLDPAAITWLDSAMSASGPVMARMRPVEVWFGSDHEQASSVSRLSVHIGSERVGELDAKTTERFRPVLEAAAERDEDPWTDAHLTRIPGPTPYLLDVLLPEVLDP